MRRPTTNIHWEEYRDCHFSGYTNVPFAKVAQIHCLFVSKGNPFAMVGLVCWDLPGLVAWAPPKNYHPVSQVFPLKEVHVARGQASKLVEPQIASNKTPKSRSTPRQKPKKKKIAGLAPAFRGKPPSPKAGAAFRGEASRAAEDQQQVAADEGQRHHRAVQHQLR